MKMLFLMRHAHAESREQSLSDFDRPLDERGREEAEMVAKYLQEKKINFDFVMCSAALRTQETLEPLRSVVGTEVIEISEDFYNSPEDLILYHLRHVSDERKKILYIGHNPGIAFAALKFTKVFPEILREGLKPATLIGFRFPLNTWADLEWWKGEVTDVFQPPLSLLELPSPSES